MLKNYHPAFIGQSTEKFLANLLGETSEIRAKANTAPKAQPLADPARIDLEDLLDADDEAGTDDDHEGDDTFDEADTDNYGDDWPKPYKYQGADFPFPKAEYAIASITRIGSFISELTLVKRENGSKVVFVSQTCGSDR